MQPRTIPTEFRLTSQPFALLGAEAADKVARFDMCLYSGKPFTGWGLNAILDLEGCAIPASQKMPMLRQHNGALIAGQSDSITATATDGIRVKGEVYPDTESGREVIATARRGFQWQASFGVEPAVEGGAFEWVDHDEQKTVNGHVFSDGLIIRKSRLKEGSFVPLGADPNTSALVAGAGQIPLPPRRSKTMSEPAPAAPTKATLADLRAAFPDDIGFACDQFEAGASLIEAKAAHADTLKAQLAEAKKALASASASTRPTRQPVPLGTPGPVEADPVTAWNAEVSSGAGSYRERVTAAAKKRPDLHAAFLKHVNGGRDVPRKEKTR